MTGAIGLVIGTPSLICREPNSVRGNYHPWLCATSDPEASELTLEGSKNVFTTFFKKGGMNAFYLCEIPHSIIFTISRKNGTKQKNKPHIQ